mmetsp:Transcript_1606/g.5606  ORF Transcript_1606/g.5606 Transcript_1606/m.5606 type:complete len:679 (+) Transcript_1606:200-2236(+)
MWYFFALSLPAVLLLTVGLLRYYKGTDVPLHVQLSVALGWLFSLSIVILVPIDVVTTLNEIRVPYVPVLWSLSYWGTQALTWFIIPFHQSFDSSGEFSVLSRLRAAIAFNLKFYAVVASLVLAVIVWIIASRTMRWRQLQATVQAASNVYGLVLGIMLLSFGLVEVPRSIWSSANILTKHKTAEYNTGKLMRSLEMAHKELCKVLCMTRELSIQMSLRDPLREYMDVLDSAASDVCNKQLVKLNPVEVDDGEIDNYGFTRSGLAALRAMLVRKNMTFQSLCQQYRNQVKEALYLENAMESLASRQPMQRVLPYEKPTSRAEHLWLCYFRTACIRFLAVVMGLASVSVILAESTAWTRGTPDLSFFSVMIRSECKSELSAQLLVLLPLSYMLGCAYYSLFRLGMFSFYMLVPHYSDSISLLQNSLLMARFAAPMCYNYLNIIHVTKVSKVDNTECPGKDTVFSQKMNVLDEIPFFGTDFNTYVPIIIGLFALLTLFNVVNAILGFLSKGLQFQFERNLDVEFVESGRAMLRLERDSLATGPANVDLGGHFIKRFHRSAADNAVTFGSRQGRASRSKTSRNKSSAHRYEEARDRLRSKAAEAQERREEEQGKRSWGFSFSSKASGSEPRSSNEASGSSSRLEEIFRNLGKSRLPPSNAFGDEEVGDTGSLLRGTKPNRRY